ncbi:Plug domain-containing protein [Sphingomonas sp. RHCKR7]|uniref:TonB-dependent receptor domain-containing protein n=1 Tax=Sphingomonas folli TaxID=2862497 RepID=UPI001C6633BC|nr:Plug domain-containing protein [Sphingomonas folli]MBW6527752.1 Plug domain-containing protein [Sphingomonas folli]
MAAWLRAIQRSDTMPGERVRMLTWGAAALATPASAQEPAPEPPASANPDVVVAARRPPGSAIGANDPVAVLDQRALRSLGVTGLKEILDRLRPLTAGIAGGDPVILLNGRRINGFAQIEAIPPEAIERAEILPEQDAARFGYPPTVRVLNLMTVKHFRSTVAQQLAGTSTRGGGATHYAEATATRIDLSRRATLQVSHFRQLPVRQAQRAIAPAPVPLAGGGSADVGAGRYLQPLTDTLRVDATAARPIGAHVDADLALRMEATRNLRRNGLAPVLGDTADGAGDGLYLPGSSLRQRDTAMTLRGNAGLHGSAGRWIWDATGGYERVRGAVTAEQARARDDPARVLASRGRSLTGTANAKLTASGPLLRLPAGELLVTTSADLARSTSGGETEADPPLQVAPVPRLHRTTAGASVSAVLPIAAASEGVLAPLGRLAATGTLGVSRVTGFGRLTSLNYGATWQPTRAIELSGSVNLAQTAPPITSLGAAAVIVPNVPVFDYASGTSVFVDALYGGNPALPPERARVATLAAALRPFAERPFDLRLEYVATRTRDRTVTPVSGDSRFQAAFPDRFGRDAAGRLVRLDLRPAAVAEEDERRLRVTLNLFTELGPKPPSPPATPDPNAPPPRPPRPRPSVYVTGSASWRLSDRLTLLPGQPALDLLDGATLDGNGGRPRWEVEGNLGGSYGPASLGLFARLQGSTRVRDLLPAADLRFSGRDWLVLYGNLDAEKLVARPWAKRLSVSFTVENLIDDRIAVRDRLGATPLRFQPGLIDPVGRSIRLGVRKLF